MVHLAEEEEAREESTVEAWFSADAESSRRFATFRPRQSTFSIKLKYALRTITSLRCYVSTSMQTQLY